MNNCITFPGTVAGAASAPAEAAEIASTIADMLHITPLPFHADQIAYYLRAGFDGSALIMAAESAQLAPRPSWAYFRGILRRCAEDGCYTADQYQARLDAWPMVKRFSGYQYGSPYDHPQAL